MPNKLSQFWQELKRRNVVRVVTVYAGVAFVLIEVINNITEPLHMPEWTPTLVIVLLGIGFPVIIIISWIYDVYPEGGVVKTESAPKVKPEDIPKISSRWKIASYISFVVIVGLIVLNVFRRPGPEDHSSDLGTSIAVLPFENMSSDEDDNYLGGAFSDEIIMELQKIKAFDRVLSRTSTMQFETQRPTIPEIADILNVNYIIEGSIQRNQDRIRIRVQVIRAKNEDHIWAEEYDRVWKDIFSIQDDIAYRVAQELNLTLAPGERKLIEKVPTTSLTAYDFYQKGREEYSNSFTELDNRIALNSAAALFRKSLQFDPGFSLAYSGLGMIHFSRNINSGFFGQQYSTEYLFGETADSVEIYADLALSFDDQNDEALCLKGYHSLEKGHFVEAEEFSKRALEINLNRTWTLIYSGTLQLFLFDYVKSISYFMDALEVEKGALRAIIHQYLMGTYASVGFPDAGEFHVNELLKLSGDSAMYFFSMSHLEEIRGNRDKASEFHLKSFEHDSLSAQGILVMGDYYYYKGQYRKAYDYYDKHFNALEESGRLNPNYMHRMAHTLWEMGRKEESMAQFDQFIELANQCILQNNFYGMQGAHFDLAGVYAFLGKKELAYAHLVNFTANNSTTNLAMFLNLLRMKDPLFERIRDEEQFQELVREADAKYQAEHERVKQWLEENDR